MFCSDCMAMVMVDWYQSRSGIQVSFVGLEGGLDAGWV
jgi:hypothetical protein